ncbi:MAG TPA: Mur ligase family protein [Thermomicrobiales bacterium]
MTGAADAQAARALARYHEAVARTNALIDPAYQRSATLEEVRERAEQRMRRLRAFLAERGEPHRRFPVVHVGGTSGKGSTATAIAAILTAAGYRTGLHLSPYLQVATEKLQIDGRLISGDCFADLVDEVLSAADAWHERTGERLTYGEIWFALVATYFAAERVDLAVIEVGAGGRFDLTNILQPAVSVITTVGFDHTETLGPTIGEIAWHKAGIIKPGAPVVTAETDPDALAPILAEARLTGSKVIHVAPDGAPGLPALAGPFQQVNAATAIAAIRALERNGWKIGEDAIAAGLAAARLPGRLETVQLAPRVVLDGAHNPQKAAALAAAIPPAVPRPPGGRLILVLGLLESKDQDGVVQALLPCADALVLTRPQVLAKPSLDPRVLADAARRAGFSGEIVVRDDPGEAIAAALLQADAMRGDAVLVTGSLYLVGNVRSRWYPDDEIVLQRTPWPGSNPD